MHTARWFAPLALVPVLFGCSSSDDSVDPTSYEALHRADSITLSCHYDERVIDSTGSNLRPGCSESTCDGMNSPSQVVIGGEIYNDHSEPKQHLQLFMGMCAGGTPVSCDAYASSGNACDACVAKECCDATFLCDHDPNCQAIADCVKSLGNDAKRIDRCLEHAEYMASKNFKTVVACLTDYCKAECE